MRTRTKTVMYVERDYTPRELLAKLGIPERERFDAIEDNDGYLTLRTKEDPRDAVIREAFKPNPVYTAEEAAAIDRPGVAREVTAAEPTVEPGVTGDLEGGFTEDELALINRPPVAIASPELPFRRTGGGAYEAKEVKA